MKNYKNYIIAILLIIGGIYLIIKPNMTFQNLIFYVGLIMLIVGIPKVLVSITSSLSMLMPGSYFLSGGLTALFGLILMLNKSSAVNIVPKIIGAWLIITSLSNIALYLNLNSKTKGKDIKDLIKNIVILVLGILCLTTPIITIIFVGSVVGLILIAAGIYMIITTYQNKNVYKVKIK